MQKKLCRKQSVVFGRGICGADVLLVYTSPVEAGERTADDPVGKGRLAG
jgi:hypothetical protein